MYIPTSNVEISQKFHRQGSGSEKIWWQDPDPDPKRPCRKDPDPKLKVSDPQPCKKLWNSDPDLTFQIISDPDLPFHVILDRDPFRMRRTFISCLKKLNFFLKSNKKTVQWTSVIPPNPTPASPRHLFLHPNTNISIDYKCWGSNIFQHSVWFGNTLKYQYSKWERDDLYFSRFIFYWKQCVWTVSLLFLSISLS